jgi:site-specific recombinase XerD
MIDVDLDRGLLTVQASKGRSRVVPIRADLAAEIRCYAANRQQVLNEHGRDEHGVLFVRLDGSPLPVAAGSLAIRRLLRELGIKPARGRVGAGAYEFRHAFAVHRLIAWAQEGVDIHAKLPWLSAYLGHQNVIGTEVYLKATPQLLDLASDRFEQHLRRSLRPQ